MRLIRRSGLIYWIPSAPLPRVATGTLVAAVSWAGRVGSFLARG